jgi:hypothetical protein
MRTLIEVSCSLYRTLLLCYPSEVRRRFHAEMTQVFADQLSDAWQLRGFAGTVQVWRTAVWELLTVAAPLGLQSPALIAAALSLLGSAALCAAFLRAVSSP